MTWCSFVFTPGGGDAIREHITHITRGDELPLKLRYIDAPHVQWWPNFLEGQINVANIRKQGFKAYIAKEFGIETPNILFFVNLEAGAGYFYRSP